VRVCVRVCVCVCVCVCSLGITNYIFGESAFKKFIGKRISLLKERKTLNIIDIWNKIETPQHRLSWH
jgi:hypothetical protein